MLVIPAVDVLDGRAVRLEQGDYERVSLEGGDPLELVAAAALREPPFVHVIALDAARDGGAPLELARNVVAAAAPIPVQLGGGVRSVGDAVAVAEAGVARILVGSAAFGPIPLAEFVSALADRVVVAVDVAEGTVRTAGWLADSGFSLEDALARCTDAGVERVLCTAIARDGTASGPDIELIHRARAAFDGELLAAGGVRGKRDIEALREAGADGAVVGRAWLEGTLDA